MSSRSHFRKDLLLEGKNIFFINGRRNHAQGSQGIPRLDDVRSRPEKGFKKSNETLRRDLHEFHQFLFSLLVLFRFAESDLYKKLFGSSHKVTRQRERSCTRTAYGHLVAEMITELVYRIEIYIHPSVLVRIGYFKFSDLIQSHDRGFYEVRSHVERLINNASKTLSDIIIIRLCHYDIGMEN